MSGPERISGIAIVPKLPATFSRVMFAPATLATLQQLADNFMDEIAWLRIIAHNKAVTVGLWLRPRHGTWRFFPARPTRWPG